VVTARREPSRIGGRALVLVCLVLALLPPAAAYAASYTYASGRNGVGGDYQGGYNSYLYNQVWHALDYWWKVYYQTTDGRQVGVFESRSNPTKWPNPIGYGSPHCHNETDGSGVLWTCQYGR
jgi:hypothetical protein